MNELEERWRDLGEFIREQRHVGQLSLRKLSEMAGISNPYLSQIERGLRKPSAEILRQIAQALSISAETLYVRAGILDERDGEADLVADIRRDPFIDEEQKKTLVHIYQSFRTERADRLAASALLADPSFVQSLLDGADADHIDDVEAEDASPTDQTDEAGPTEQTATTDDPTEQTATTDDPGEPEHAEGAGVAAVPADA